MKKPTIFNETSVALKVGTPDLPDSDWQAVVRYLANKFDFAVSPLSFIEVLNSLARGDERFIIPNLRRLEALSPLEPLNPTFLEMPGQFVLREVLGCGPTLVDTYQPWQMKEAMVTLIRHSSVTPELRAWLAEIQGNHQSGTDDYSTKHEEIRKIGQTTPDRELWLRAKLAHLGIVLPSEEELRKLGIALDAAYEYSAWIRRQLENPSYLPARDASSWIDYQQLFYLSNPDMHILYVDGDFTDRTGRSHQQSRLIKLADVLADIRKRSLISA